MHKFKRIIVICGHYGCGKTNLSLNMAVDLRRQSPVTLIDLDIVNPYFRSSDYTGFMEQRGIKVISPNLAGSTLDTPSLSAAVYSAVDSGEGYVIIDAGGDDSGATALGRFAGGIRESGYDMLFVVNERRGLIADPADAVQIMREIETASHLYCSAVVNNTHLGGFTDADILLSGELYAEKVAQSAGLPLLFNAAERRFDKVGLKNPYYVDILVRTPWEPAIL